MTETSKETTEEAVAEAPVGAAVDGAGDAQAETAVDSTQDTPAEAGVPEKDLHPELSEEERLLMGADMPSGDEPAATNGIKVLVAGSQEKDRVELTVALENRGFEVQAVSGFHQALESLAVGPFDVILMSMNAANPQALGVLRELVAHENSGAVLLATRRPTPGLVFQAARAGAAHVIVIPPSDEAIDRIRGLTAERMAA